jgi:signal transduction histidine kinase
LLEDALQQVQQIMQQVRSLSLELRPPMMDDLGLLAALRWHIKGVASRSGLAIRLHADLGGERLDAELEMACFRVVQEAINNVVKHARASAVAVDLRAEEKELHLSVRDDGDGFNVAAARKRIRRGPSLGLLGMEERVLLLGGQFGIESAPGQGVEVRARFPLGAAGLTSRPDEETP